MDGQQFDRITKALGRTFLESQSRRVALGAALALLGLAVPGHGAVATSRRHSSGGHAAGEGKKKKGGGKGKGGKKRCKPNNAAACAGRQCGSAVNNCRQTVNCGSCSGNNVCQGGVCVCVGSCAGRQCGDNGCGVSCGTCTILGQSCQNGRCAEGAHPCGVGANICPASGDAECCVAGQKCCPAGTGLNGCCGEVDYTCLSPNASFPQGRCEPDCGGDPEFNVPCTNDVGCCTEDFPVCCSAIGFCCATGFHCGTSEDDPCLPGSSSLQAQGDSQRTAAALAGRHGRRMRTSHSQARHQ